jgi:hypothetical protein
MLTNISSGDFYIIPGFPTNCGVYLLSNVLSTVIGVTNTVTVSNIPPVLTSGTYLLSSTYISWYTNHNLAYFPVECVTNFSTLTYISWYTNHNLAYFPVECVTNFSTRTYINWWTNHELAYFPVECVTNVETLTYINWFTNYTLAYFPVVCPTNTVALRQGIEKVTFIREDYDSLLGTFFNPVTNYYTLTSITTTNTLFPQRIQRVVTQPDILISAVDLASAFPAIPTVARGAPGYDITGESTTGGEVPPGDLRGPANFQFNKVGPIYLNATYPLFIDQSGALLDFVWASYDGTTNAPVVYPNGTSIQNLENQVLIQITPPYLPDGTNGILYGAQLQTSADTPNWQSPFTWSLGPASPGLPPGLVLSNSGLISGTPNQAGFYNFVVQAVDAVGRTEQKSYVMNVDASP